MPTQPEKRRRRAEPYVHYSCSLDPRRHCITPSPKEEHTGRRRPQTNADTNNRQRRRGGASRKRPPGAPGAGDDGPAPKRARRAAAAAGDADLDGGGGSTDADGDGSSSSGSEEGDLGGSSDGDYDGAATARAPPQRMTRHSSGRQTTPQPLPRRSELKDSSGGGSSSGTGGSGSSSSSGTDSGPSRERRPQRGAAARARAAIAARAADSSDVDEVAWDGGPRVDGKNCSAASAIEQNGRESDVVDGLNAAKPATAEQLRRDGNKAAAELVERLQACGKCVVGMGVGEGHRGGGKCVVRRPAHRGRPGKSALKGARHLRGPATQGFELRRPLSPLPPPAGSPPTRPPTCTSSIPRLTAP